MSETTRLKMPVMAAGQAEKHVTHNEALEVLDALVQLAVKSATVTVPPASPVVGDRYLVPAGATGAWSALIGQIVRWDGAWVAHAPATGWMAVVEDTGRVLFRIGASWLDLADFAWFRAAGSDAQAKIIKQASGAVASLVFQTAFSGRAEIGLVGDDDLTVKVSPDGTTWTRAFAVDRTTGFVTFDRGSERVQLDTFTASGVWTKPDWARRVVVIAVGGGGGGGSGGRGASGTDRRGGGGGGAGGWATETFLADELPATLNLDIGSGGAGAPARTTNDTNGADGTAGSPTIVRDGATYYLYAGGGGGGSGGVPAGGFTAAGGFGSGPAANSGPAGSLGNGSTGTETALRVGAGGGGAGAGLSSAGATGTGGRGGHGYHVAFSTPRIAAGGTGGAVAVAGGAGSGKSWPRGCGGGGGGGGSGNGTGTQAGGSGGTGGAPGGGGGGGGASTNGANSGAGGTGGRGEVWIIAFG